MIGQVIGNYRIVSELGKGGMGMVYRAEHVQLGRPAALKMLLPQLSSDPAIVQRFFNEARAASAIDHPGIVEVYDFGTHTDGAAYIVMALLKGESLQRRLQRGPVPPLEGAALVAQVLGALAAAHGRGIVHRDLKPDNIFLVPNELMPGGIQIKLLDFGIAKLSDDQSAELKTQTGVMMGTPAYMSPEQCMGRSDLDHRTDLYAIGCILFHVLTGRPPFVSEHGTGMMIAAHMRDAPPHPRSLNASIPDGLAAIVMRLLEKEPAARYQTALEVREALAAVGAGAPSRPPMAADQYAATVAPSFAPGHALHATVPTTASGSAAQVIATVPTTRKGNAGVVIGVGLLLAALGGVGVWAAMRGDDKPAEPVAQAGTGSATTAAPLVAAPPPAAPADPPAAADTPCPLGQVRGPDTHGQCCWPDQAWSSSKARCVGKPRCPEGHKAAGEDCAVVVAAAPRQEAKPVPRQHGPRVPPRDDTPPPPPPPPSGTVPKFRLDAKAYAPGATIQIMFASPIASPANNRSWITVVEASKAPSDYGTWKYIADGAKDAALTAPKAAGRYEVRLHTDYPQRAHNVRQAIAISVKDDATPVGVTARHDQRFMLASKVAQLGEQIELTFPIAMKAAAGERFWITVVEPSAGASAYGAYEYVPDGARTMLFTMPKIAGEYEIRLHANYPRLTTNLVHRARIRVED